MSKQTFRVSVTKIVSVEFDTDKLDAEFWHDFHTSITEGADIDDLAKHAAWNFVQGAYDFNEGIGDLREMNVVIREIDSEVEIEDRP